MGSGVGQQPTQASLKRNSTETKDGEYRHFVESRLCSGLAALRRLVDLAEKGEMSLASAGNNHTGLPAGSHIAPVATTLTKKESRAQSDSVKKPPMGERTRQAADTPAVCTRSNEGCEPASEPSQLGPSASDIVVNPELEEHYAIGEQEGVDPSSYESEGIVVADAADAEKTRDPSASEKSGKSSNISGGDREEYPETAGHDGVVAGSTAAPSSTVSASPSSGQGLGIATSGPASEGDGCARKVHQSAEDEFHSTEGWGSSKAVPPLEVVVRCAAAENDRVVSDDLQLPAPLQGLENANILEHGHTENKVLQGLYCPQTSSVRAAGLEAGAKVGRTLAIIAAEVRRDLTRNEAALSRCVATQHNIKLVESARCPKMTEGIMKACFARSHGGIGSRISFGSGKHSFFVELALPRAVFERRRHVQCRTLTSTRTPDR